VAYQTSCGKEGCIQSKFLWRLHILLAMTNSTFDHVNLIEL